MIDLLCTNLQKLNQITGIIIYTLFFALGFFDFWHFFLYKFEWLHLVNFFFVSLFFFRMGISESDIDKGNCIIKKL